MSVNRTEIEKLARLARLELEPEQASRYAEDISGILQYVNKLSEVRVEGLGNEAGVEAGLRPDRAVGLSLSDQQELIGLAPETEGGLVKTKAVFE